MHPFVIDMSHHNTLTDPPRFNPAGYEAAVKAGLIGVIHKATQGVGMSDNMYALRRKRAADSGLLWGAYHFNTGEAVAAQVQHFLDMAQPDAQTLMALDFEDNRASEMSAAQAAQFLTLLDQHLGRKAIIYGGNRLKEQLPRADAETRATICAHRLWLCQYGPRAVLPPGWDKYWLWQYSGDGIPAWEVSTFPGFVDRGLDLNWYAGSSDQLKAEWVS